MGGSVIGEMGEKFKEIPLVEKGSKEAQGSYHKKCPLIKGKGEFWRQETKKKTLGRR